MVEAHLDDILLPFSCSRQGAKGAIIVNRRRRTAAGRAPATNLWPGPRSPRTLVDAAERRRTLIKLTPGGDFHIDVGETFTLTSSPKAVTPARFTTTAG
jgi:hypothetical protein